MKRELLKLAILFRMGPPIRIFFRWGIFLVLAAASPVVAGPAKTTIHLSDDILSSSYQSFALQFTNAIAADAESGTLVILQANGTVEAATDNASFHVPPGLAHVMALSGGLAVDMALTSDGTVTAWGDNEFEQNDLPPHLSKVIAIAAGWRHALALQMDGTVVSWGEIATVPIGLSNIVAIAAGQQRNLALRANGTVVEWGPNANAVPSGLTDVIAISADHDGDLALKADGTVVQWDNNFTSVVPGVSNAVAIAGCSDVFLALNADGSVVSAGTKTLSFSGVLSNAFAISVGQSVDQGAVVTGDGSPVFTVQPGNQSPRAGGTIWLHARAVGLQPMNYQWMFNGSILTGATNSDLIIKNATVANSGRYLAIAGNLLNWAPSTAAVVSVSALASPAARLRPHLSQPVESPTVASADTNSSTFPVSNSEGLNLAASRDLIDWRALSNAVKSMSNELEFSDPEGTTNWASISRPHRP